MINYIEYIAKNNLKALLNNNNKKFNLLILPNITKNEIVEEVIKIIYFFQYETYLAEKNIRLGAINDYLIYFTKDYLKYIFDLLKYSQEFQLSNEFDILSFYLYSLNSSYNKGEAYSKADNSPLKLKEFYKVFSNRGFYKGGRIYKGAHNFANNVIKYSSENTDMIFSYWKLLIYCVDICSGNNNEQHKMYINKLIKKETFINYYIIKYDNNVEENYIQYIETQLKDINTNAQIKFDIIIELYKKNIVTEDDEEKIVLKLYETYNTICLNKEHILIMSQYKALNKNIILLRSINNMSIKTKEKLKKLQQIILKELRSFVKNDKEENYTMLTTEFTIPEEDMKNIIESLRPDIVLGFYTNFMIDFEGRIINYLKDITTNIMQHLVSKINVENIYEGIIETEERMTANNNMKEYFTKLIDDKFNEVRGELINTHIYEKEKAYDGYNRYLKTLFDINIGIAVEIIKKNFGDDLEKKIFEDFNYEFFCKIDFNHQIVIMNLIILIEKLILDVFNEIFNEKILTFNENMLDEIFIRIKENSPNLIKCIMFINYSLYETNGYKIRNKIAHGNFPCGFKDYRVLYIVIMSYLNAKLLSHEIVGLENV